MVTKKQKQSTKAPFALRWFYIPLWITLTIILTSTGLLGSIFSALQIYDPTVTNLAGSLFLLIPIALMAFPLAYYADLSRFSVQKKPLALSIGTRILFSLCTTGIILAMSWYLFLIINIAIYTSL